ncbi:MAG: methionyl-tRNA formyltransferase [Candidatus Omnitrophota bacterium]
MRIVFFGSSQFAVPALEALLRAGHEISCVITQPDKKQGRGMRLAPTPIKKIAISSKLKIYQPSEINTPETIKLLKNLNPDLFVVIAYGQFLAEEILNIPRILPINLHASILPKYRGAAPINWAIINAEKKTGNSIIKMVKKMDAGPILFQEETKIADNETVISLEERLSHMGVALLLISIDAIASGIYNLLAQNESKVTFAPRLKKSDGLIDWGKPAQDIYNLIRGCLEWPGAFTYYKGKILKVFQAQVIRTLNKHTPGELVNVSSKGLSLGTGKGILLVKELQIEGKRRMSAQEFLIGYKPSIGDILGKK